MMAGSLPELVQSLPRELYEHVFALTFTVFGGCIDINEAVRPPNMFHVSRATREQVAKRYYGSTTFRFTNRKVLIAWLAALDPSHRELLQSITLKIPNPLNMATSLTHTEVAQPAQMQQSRGDAAQMGRDFDNESDDERDDESLQDDCGFFQTLFMVSAGKSLAKDAIDDFREDLANEEHWAAPDILGWLTIEVEGLGQYIPEYVMGGRAVAREWRSF